MSTGAGMFQGAASGAATGAMFGPWGAVAGGVIGGLSGLFGSRSAKRAAQQKEQLARQQDMERRAAQGWQADEMTRLGNQYGEASKFVPQGIRTNFGSAGMGEDGTMTSNLDHRYMNTEMRDKWGNLFNQEYDRMQGFDPEKLAAERYGMMQKLVAGDRAAKTDSTVGMLLRRGLIGSAANDGTGTQSNPLMSGLQRGFADEDTKLALESMDFADRRRQSGFGLLGGMQGQMQGIDRQAFEMSNGLMQSSYGWSNMMNNHRMTALNNQYGMYGDATNARTNSMMPADFVRNAANNVTDVRQARDHGAYAAIPQLFQGFSGMFGGGSSLPPMREAPGEGGGSFTGRF